MLRDLEIGEARAVEPEKMKRTPDVLPAAIRVAFDKTPVGEARFVTINNAGEDPEKTGKRLVALLKRYARDTNSIAYKAHHQGPAEGGSIGLYWQKKARAPEPAILPRPAEEVYEPLQRPDRLDSEPAKKKGR